MHGGDIYRNKVNIDFSVNINPLGIPEGIKKAMHCAIDEVENYPDIYSMKLREMLAEKYNLSIEDVIVGNGASEIFMAIVHAIRPRKAVIATPSFLGYEKCLNSVGCVIDEYILAKENNFALKEDFLDMIDAQTDVIFLASPNNPTGVCIEDGLLKKIATRAKEFNVKVVLDECFIEFTDNSDGFIKQLKLYDNIIIVRAFTKIYSIPGVRLGYAMACNKDLVKSIVDCIPEWNVSYIAQKAGEAALLEKEFLDDSKEYVKKERFFLEKCFMELGIKIYPSKANFFLIQSKIDLYGKLLEMGILIRDCSNFNGLISGFYRVAVKNREDNEKLISALKQIL